jgi:hypothetical protein
MTNNLTQFTGNNDNVNTLVAILESNTKPLEYTFVDALRLGDVQTAIWIFYNNLHADDLMERGVNKDYKPEIQAQQRAANRAKADETFMKGVTRLKDEVNAKTSVYFNSIKKGKFPLWSDASTKVIGEQEFQLAYSMPLKYINTPLLMNYYSNGHIDIVSHLIERVSMNLKEFGTSELKDIQSFARTFYEALKITEARSSFTKLAAINRTIDASVANFTNASSNRLAGILQVQRDEARLDAGDDNLTEVLW